MVGGKHKQKSWPLASKEHGKAVQDETASTTPLTTRPQLQKASTDESNKSRKSGTLSSMKFASAVFSNVTITPAMNSGRRRKVVKPEPTTAPKETAEPTEAVRSTSHHSIPDRDAIEVQIDQGSEPRNWMIFTVPFDRSNKSVTSRWNGSQGYTFRESMEWRFPRETYLNSLLPPRPDPQLKRNDLTVFLKIEEPLETIACQTATDVRFALGTILWMSKFINISVNLSFAMNIDEELKSRESQDIAANLVQAIIMDLQDKEEEIIMQKKAKNIAALAGPLWFDLDPESGLGVDYQSRVAQCYESSATRNHRSSVTTRDFAYAGSSRAAGKRPMQRTLRENAETMTAWMEEEKSLASEENPEIATSD